MTDFRCKYRIDDGFVGKREKSFYISESEIDEDMTLDDLSNLFEESMQDSFEQKVFPDAVRKEDFMAWGESVINKIIEDGEK